MDNEANKPPTQHSPPLPPQPIPQQTKQRKKQTPSPQNILQFS